MVNTQSQIDSLRELNSKLVAEIANLRKENTEIPELKKENAVLLAENARLKRAMEEHEARFAKLEQNDKDKTSLIAKLDDDIKEIKQGHSEKETLTYCETPEQINDKSNSDIYQKSITQCYASPIHTETKSLEEKEYDEFLESEHRKNVGNEIRERNREKKIRAQESLSTSQATPSNMQMSIDQNENQNISAGGLGQNSTILTLAQLFDKAIDAECGAIRANQEEILRWCYYGKEFLIQVSEIIKNSNGKIGEKKAKGIVYDKILEHISIIRKKRSEDTGLQLPEISRKYLQGKTQKAVKIYKLFEKIGIDKIKYIKIYSANSISELTNDKIQTIINHFSKNIDTDLPDSSINNSSDDLPETEVCVPTTASIPLTHIPNSSGPDDFPEVELSESTITPIPSAHISKSSGLGDLPKTQVSEKVELRISDESKTLGLAHSSSIYQGFNSDFSDNDEVNNWSATYSDNDDEAGYYWNPSTGKKIYKESMELTCSA
ncbi:4504_t:CDS:1 [Entrophospora sp. SA101]|nr:4504_t:CDS:1 [Entrophospora sp. SA101]